MLYEDAVSFFIELTCHGKESDVSSMRSRMQ
jgi:hypothetical protein